MSQVSPWDFEGGYKARKDLVFINALCFFCASFLNGPSLSEVTLFACREHQGLLASLGRPWGIWSLLKEVVMS